MSQRGNICNPRVIIAPRHLAVTDAVWEAHDDGLAIAREVRELRNSDLLEAQVLKYGLLAEKVAIHIAESAWLPKHTVVGGVDAPLLEAAVTKRIATTADAYR